MKWQKYTNLPTPQWTRPHIISFLAIKVYDRWNNIPHYTQTKNMEEGLVSPHWLVTTRITPSFPFSKTNLANIHSESNPKH